MIELALQQYLLHEYPQENARSEWNVFVKPNEQSGVCPNYAMARKGRMKSKEFKNLKTRSNQNIMIRV